MIKKRKYLPTYARGPPGNRFYFVQWLGKNETNVTIGGCAPGCKWTPTWEPERFLVDAQKRIEKADERVQWGKENGPYCRFRLDGTSEGNYIDQPRPTT